jgi:hypothetical protein
MTTFPALIPSSRAFSPGEYPATAFAGYSGAQNRVRHSNVFLAAQLRLTFLGLNEAQMLDIWNHYNGRRGEFRSFALPAEVVSYGSITDYVPGTYQWIYTGPGQVDDLPCGGHNVTLTLETVPPSSASVVGTQLFIGMRLTVGTADGGEYELGISQSIALSIDTGLAFIALNGIAATLGLALQPMGASGDASAAGLNQLIALTLNTGAAINAGAAGISEVITLSLTAGAADGGAPVDPNFSSVTLLLHMDGSNGSTTFTDSSSSALTVTANGNAQISTAQSKFGGASGLFDGNGDYLLVPADGTAIGAGDFTVECFFRIVEGSGYRAIVSFLPNTDQYTLYVLNNTLIWYDSGTQIQSASIPNNTWHHAAVTNSGNTVRVFLDGEQAATTYTSAKNITNQTLRIGTRGFANSEWFSGYIDEFRLTKGIARYTANFTPPTAPFPDA